MVLGRTMFGIGRLGATLALVVMSVLTACAGKSERNNEDGDSGDSGDSGDESDDAGGSGARGGTSGSGKGGSGKGGTTSNVLVMRVTQTAVDKADLLFMVDNSISMADKQQILAEAVPVLVRRLVDPVCVDDAGNATGDNSSSDGCNPGTAEFPPFTNIHIGVITSSLGNHGGDVCVPDPMDTVARTLNDQAQLIASVRTGLYSYANQGFLTWDPRTGSEVPNPDPHPGKGENETNVGAFVTDFTSHVTAAGERGCGYEAQLETWYRFLIDPEPTSAISNDGSYSVRGPVNEVVLTQRAMFMRPDSLLAIVMLTDENDCSINDENNAQGWLVGRRIPMPRSSSECSRPDDQDLYECCRPCVIDLPGCPPSAGDVECVKGTHLMPIEDSTNLRCFQQSRRFGIDLLYPWQRYSNALRSSRILLRDGGTEVSNPIYTPGVDGTPAREAGLVFLVGIVGVPWQDLADAQSLMPGTELRYLTAAELSSPPSGPNRWDVILGDPDLGVPPLDPFMIETVDPRNGANPITNDPILPPAPGSGGNAINGHEQNIVNRDDLQYACTFDLVPDNPCTGSNQDGCDCNASEQGYNRPLCEYPGGSADGTQTHAKAYPGVRHLQVLKDVGNNAIVASICPKEVSNQDSPGYGYNPAVSAMVRRFREAVVPGCLPRPLADANGQIGCSLVEARLPSAAGCDCALPGRSDLGSGEIAGAIQDELTAGSLCGGNTGVSCSDYCLCEIQQFSGSDLEVCRNSPTDPATQFGYCYVDESTGDPALLANCPATQRQVIRFMGPDVPAPRSIAFVACVGGQ